MKNRKQFLDRPLTVTLLAFAAVALAAAILVVD